MPAPQTTTSAASAIVLSSPVAGRLVDGDPLLDGNACDQLADDVQRQVVSLAEMDARFAHVQLLAGRGEAGAQPRRVRGAAVRGHEVERVVILLAGEADVPERLLVVGL